VYPVLSIVSVIDFENMLNNTVTLLFGKKLHASCFRLADRPPGSILEVQHEAMEEGQRSVLNVTSWLSIHIYLTFRQ
jgi:hypothetical protein